MKILAVFCLLSISLTAAAETRCVTETITEAKLVLQKNNVDLSTVSVKSEDVGMIVGERTGTFATSLPVKIGTSVKDIRVDFDSEDSCKVIASTIQDRGW